MSAKVNTSPVSDRIFLRFFEQIAHGGYPLFLSAIAALLWANYSNSTYYAFWHTDFSFKIGWFTLSKSVVQWIDEALMALFFFTVGLEIKREFLVGELSSAKKAILPVMAAIGGMALPAGLYYWINISGDTVTGWGIPMATDIAFSLAILSLLGKKAPFGLIIFLTAFAIVDDLGSVLIIAIFYTPEIHLTFFYIAAAFLFGLFVANLLWIRNPLVYIVLGIGLWFAVLESGVHATIAGVITAMFIPAKGKYDTRTFVRNVRSYLANFESKAGGCGHSILLNRTHQNAVLAIDVACRDVETPLQRLEHSLQSWVSLLILPLFALANAGLVLKGMNLSEAALHPISLGVFIGLVVGKPVGISLFVWLSVKFFRAELSPGVSWKDIIGVSFLGGVGFTMSMFLTGLSFARPIYLEYAKLGIISGSILCGFVGFIILAYPGKKPLDANV
jgi:NhaA family Na+:H+ antiporter